MASDGYGGAEKVFVELSNGLAERHEVAAMLIRGCAFRSRFSDKVQLIELKSNPTRHNPFLHYEIYRAVRRFSPDIIHTHAAKGAELVRKISRFTDIPHLGTKHNDRTGRIFNSLKWEIRYKTEQKDDTRKQGEKEAEGNAACPVGYTSFINSFKEKHGNIIKTQTLKPG